ncbi:efflux RND transporter periplasmic adaptor subunit [Fodinisporobacter ferrooxydans]|uniref:Efflux RND transporter periplasmic adaptor subunit n=1 Tax=Fodinisporobacter ferrooxydans TaxID=2901836 RepID=A0ABY4CSD2_9BACL|nr:efflux RND transporter periplasmic adaptor subunit [Alicyclobacillaceae bacterium MYW30-H2]
MKHVILTNVIIILVVLAAVAGGWYYYNQSANYVTTDNAQITGRMVAVTSSAPGKLVTWNGTVGQTVTANQVIGNEDVQGPLGDVKTPIAGTVIQSNASQGEVVIPGMPLATIADLGNLYVIANIDETNVNDVKIGKTVDVTVDAFPGTLTGTVNQIGMATQSTFSVLPSNNASGNYTKTTQRIPVKIVLQDYNNNLIPGLNCSVRIHK